MELRERLEAAGSVVGEREAHGSAAVGVGIPFDQAGVLRAVDESDRAVVSQQEVAGDISDGGTGWIWVALDGEQELVLGGGQVLRACLLRAPAQEASQAGPELEQALVVGIGEMALHIVARYRGASHTRPWRVRPEILEQRQATVFSRLGEFPYALWESVARCSPVPSAWSGQRGGVESAGGEGSRVGAFVSGAVGA